MSQDRAGDVDRGAEVRSRLSREFALWLEFAPEAVVSVGHLALVGVLALALGSWWLAIGGTGVWLAAAAVWVLLGRMR